MQTKLSRVLQLVRRICWAAFLISLPVTSFPFFPEEFGGKALVRPLALYPLVVLLILVTIPSILRRPLPKAFLPLLVFALFFVISSLFALASGPESLRGVSQSERLLRNLLTLLIGGAFYMTVALYPQDWTQLRQSLKWLYLGFGVALLWGSFQVVYILDYSQDYFRLLNKIQGLISTRRLFPARISGLTYEPKWFAEQICFLLFPWLLGFVLHKQSLFQRRLYGITVELALLIWAAVVLVFTFSRTGLLIMVVLAFLSILYYGIRSGMQARKNAATGRVTMRSLLQATAGLLVLFAVILSVGTRNPYFSRFWRYWTTESIENRTFLEYIGAQQRIVYLETAFLIYADHPLFGVGPGNYAFEFLDYLPDRPYQRQPELVRQMTPSDNLDRLITPKNLYGRLLAETGLLGTAAFTVFILAVLGGALSLWWTGEITLQSWGTAGLFGIFVFTIASWSFDSFAIPNMWVVFGLVTAAVHINHQGFGQGETPEFASQIDQEETGAHDGTSGHPI